MSECVIAPASSHAWLTALTLEADRDGTYIKLSPYLPPSAQFPSSPTMSPTLMPVPPARSPFNARSAILRHVKRSQGRPDAPLNVLAIVCLVVLAVILLSIARYFYRTRSQNSPSSPDPGSRSSFHWFFPRCLRSLGTSNRTGRTTTLSHHNPIPAFPPGDPVRPWPPTYCPAYSHVYDHPRRHSYPPYQPVPFHLSFG